MKKDKPRKRRRPYQVIAKGLRQQGIKAKVVKVHAISLREFSRN